MEHFIFYEIVYDVLIFDLVQIIGASLSFLMLAAIN